MRGELGHGGLEHHLAALGGRHPLPCLYGHED
jgi:hypothetical protein